MNQNTVSLPAVTVAYFRAVGPYGPTIEHLWGEVIAWAKPRGLWTGSRICYGISHDSPMDTPPEKCRYDACIVLLEDFVIDGGALRETLPGGLYARLPFYGVGSDVSMKFQKLFREVIPATGKQFDPSRPVFELYAGEIEMVYHRFACDLCAPIK